MRKVRISVKGLVQGVGFRFMTQRVAQEIGQINGIVRNENDGSVTIEAVGPDEKISQFIERVRKSPAPSGYVETCNVEEDDHIPIRRNFSVDGYW